METLFAFRTLFWTTSFLQANNNNFLLSIQKAKRRSMTKRGSQACFARTSSVLISGSSPQAFLSAITVIYFTLSVQPKSQTMRSQLRKFLQSALANFRNMTFLSTRYRIYADSTIRISAWWTSRKHICINGEPIKNLSQCSVTFWATLILFLTLFHIKSKGHVLLRTCLMMLYSS